MVNILINSLHAGKFCILNSCNIIIFVSPAKHGQHIYREWGQMVKIQLFKNIVMLHIKLKGITDASTW